MPLPVYWNDDTDTEEDDSPSDDDDSSMPPDDDDSSMPPPDQHAGRAIRRKKVYRAALFAHRRVKAPSSEAQAVDRLIRFLIDMTGVTMQSDPDYYQYMLEWPIMALIKFSKLCTNHWCGTAAIVLVEELAHRFPVTRVLPREDDAYVTKLRDMTEAIMSCYHNRVSQTPFPLSTDPTKVSLGRINQMMEKLVENKHISTEEYDFLVDIGGADELIRRINFERDALGGLKGGELVKWYLCDASRAAWEFAKLDLATLDLKVPMDADDALRRVEEIESTDTRTYAMVGYLFGAGLTPAAQMKALAINGHANKKTRWSKGMGKK